MTPAADAMLPASTVAHVCDGVFLDDMPRGLEKRPGHLELASWSDTFVILPASANVIGQAANGIASNLLTTTILASTMPVIFCPNVHESMWSKRALQRNIETLEKDGYLVVHPELTMVYEVEFGRMQESRAMPDPGKLVEHLRALLESPKYPT